MIDELNRCHFGDVRDVLRQMIAAGVKVNCIVTSPPYWGLRSYLPPGHQDKPLTGHFQIYLESASAASKVLVQGDFTVDHIRKDIWGYSPSLEERKTEENNTPTCGEDRLTTTPE